MASLARELRMDDQVLIWHRPYARLRQYQHALLRARNEWTVAADKPVDEYFARLGL